MLSVWTCLYFCLAVAAAQSLDLYEGDICKQSKGSLWSCKLLKECPKARADLKKGIRPEICRFSGTDPIVCCEPEVKPPPTGAKAREMCKKYAESVFIRIPNPLGDGFSLVDTCAQVEPLITNGEKADYKEYPHMALIGYGSQDIQWLCGGSLISERYVLSAAHCTDGGKLGPARWVRLGDYNFMSTVDDEMGFAQSKEFEIIERINHPEYKPNKRDKSEYNDITLYKLNKDVEFSEYIRPICLQTDYQFAKTYAVATGWGKIEYNFKRSDVLLKVNLTLTERKTCTDIFAGSAIRSQMLKEGIRGDSQLCAGGLDDGKDTCQGDSGGPLQIPVKEPHCMYNLVGVTSLGVNRCQSSYPGVYTRVSHFVPWIESIVWP